MELERSNDPRHLHFDNNLTLITASGEAFNLALPEDDQTAPPTDHVAVPIAESQVAQAVLASPPPASCMPPDGALGQQGRNFSAQKVKGTIGIRKSGQRRASLLDMAFSAPAAASSADEVAANAANAPAPTIAPPAVAATATAPDVAEPENIVDPVAAGIADEAAARRAAPKPPAEDTLLEGFCTVKLLRKGEDYVPSKVYIRGNGVLDTFLISATKEGLAPALRKNQEAEIEGSKDGQDDTDDVVVEYVYDKSYQVLYATNPSIVTRLARLITKSQELWTCADCIEVPCKPNASMLKTYIPTDASVKPISMLFTFSDPEECKSFQLALQPYCIVPPYSPGYLEDMERQTAALSPTPQALAYLSTEPAEPPALSMHIDNAEAPAITGLDVPQDTTSTQRDERGRSPRSGRYPSGPPPTLPSRDPEDNSRSLSPSAAQSSSGPSSSSSGALEDDQALSSDDKSAARARSADLLLSVSAPKAAPVSPRVLRKQQKEKEKEEKRLAKEAKKREKEQKKKEAKEAKKAKSSKATKQYRKPSAFPGIPVRTESCAADLLVKRDVSRSRSPAARASGQGEPSMTISSEDGEEKEGASALSPDEPPKYEPTSDGSDDHTPDSSSVAIDSGSKQSEDSISDVNWSKTSQPEEVLSALHDTPEDGKSTTKLSTIPGVLKTRTLLK